MKQQLKTAHSYWFDTEFIEDGVTIKPLSIGIVARDNREYYAEFICDKTKANRWVIENVLPHLGKQQPKSAEQIKNEIVEFVGPTPVFWGYYVAYDWVLFCQLFGTMIDLPHGWPMLSLDVKQLQYMLDVKDVEMPKQTSHEHHALEDARWTKKAWEFLSGVRCARGDKSEPRS